MTPAENYSIMKDPQVHFRAALYFTFILTLFHLASFPLVATYDGMEYVHLADVVWTPAFPAEWNFFRTPLFPLALKGAFVCFGEQPQAALLVTTLLGWAGIVLMGLTAANIAGGTAGAAVLLLLSFYPELAGYQHILLSESGIFFFLALLVWSLIAFQRTLKRQSLLFPFAIVLVVSLGYYWRPTILFLSPFVLLCYVLIAWGVPGRLKSYLPLLGVVKRQPIRILSGMLIVAAGPWLITYPWRQMTNKFAPGLDTVVLGMGAFKQVLILPDDPALGELRDPYRALIQHQSVDGVLPMAGLSAGDNMELMSNVARVAKQRGLTQLVMQRPFWYLSGVARSLIFFMGVPGHPGDDENGRFSRSVFSLWPSEAKFDNSLGWDKTLLRLTPHPYNGKHLLGRLFLLLQPIYTWITLTASILSLGWLFVSLVRADPVGVTAAGVPIVFIFLHSLTLFTMDRYAFPIYPIVLTNLVILSARSIAMLTRWRQRPRHVEARTK